MSWTRTTLMDLGGSAGGQGRVAWADTAKAISIILLVFYTIYGSDVQINRMLVLARMPAFFFISGLFAFGVVTRSNPGTFFRVKLGNLVYLYVLWATLVFLSTRLVAHFWWGREIDLVRQASLLWAPVGEMWFIYGLALAFLVARLCRGLPVLLVFAVSLVGYAIAVATGDWFDIPFLEKVVRLFPFFWLGITLRPLVWRTVERYWRLWPLPVAAYLAATYAFFDTAWNQFPPLTFAITSIGVLGLLMLSAHLARFRWAWPLSIVGASTLYIYATQHVTIFYMERLAAIVGKDVVNGVVISVVVVIWGTIFGRWAARTPAFAWLFKAPWLIDRRRATPATA
jgi:fucose 4-O-acetylase-like acetyltransferase